MNLFIWDQTQDLYVVGLYNVVVLLVHCASFNVFAPLVKKGRPHLPRNIGLIGSALTMFWVFSLGAQAVDYIVTIGILRGIFNGMYWISYHILKFDFTRPANRGNFKGIEVGMRQGIKIVVPAIGGFFIAQNFGGLGYASIFLLSGLLYTLSLLVGAHDLPDHTPASFHMKKTWKEMKKNKDIMRMVYARALSNMGRRGVIERLLPILIFDVLQNELHVGGWLSVFAVVGVATTIIGGKFMRYDHLRGIVTILGGLTFLSFFSLIGLPNIVTYIFFGIVAEILIPLMGVTTHVYAETLLHKLDNYKSHRIEYFVIKEWIAVGVGRTFSFALLLFVGSLEAFELKILLLVLACAILAETWLIRSIKTKISSIV